MGTVPRSMQQAVDDLAESLGRPAVVEDYDHRVVVHSVHDEPGDEVRRRSLQRRHTTLEVMTWLREQGITEATGPVRIPGCPELRMLPRVCIPVRHRGTLLGYVWFIDADRKVPLARVRTAFAATDDLAVLLQDSRTSPGTDLVRTLLGGDQPARVTAARSLAATGYGALAGGTAALAARPGPGRWSALAAALASLARAAGAVHLMEHDHGVLLTTAASVARQAARLHADGVAVTVGVGGVQDRLEHAAESYRQAHLAMRVAGVQPGLGPVADWGRLGVYRVLDSLPVGTEIHPGLARLLRDPSNQPLIDTLEVYLDLAGNADAAARRLHLHRTSLYYRLQRLEALAGTSLKDGGERLSLHLTLKAARLHHR